MNQLHVFVTGGSGSLLQIQLAAHRDTKYIHTGSLTPGNQGLEHLLRRKTQAFCGMDATQILFVIFVKVLPTGDARLLYQAHRIGLSSHLITITIIQYDVNTCKRIDPVKPGYPKEKHMEAVMDNKKDPEMMKQER